MASARMCCQIDCRLTAGYQAVEKGDVVSGDRAGGRYRGFARSERSSVGPSSTHGTFWGLTLISASFPRWKTAFTTIVPTIWWS